MPRHQGLLRRGSRWYLNLKVPKGLQKALGKEHVRVSLNTSDYQQAARKVSYERARWSAYFENEHAKLARQSAPSPTLERPKQVLTALSMQEAFQWSIRYLSSREKEFREWMDKEGHALPDWQAVEIAANIAADEAHLAEREDFKGKRADGSRELNQFLREQGVECAATSPAFEALRPMIYDAHLEFLARAQDLLKGEPAKERNLAFKGVHAYSPAIEEAPRGFTVEDLIQLKEQTNQDLGRRVKTVVAFNHAARLLRETLGGDRLLATLTREDMAKVFNVMKEIPLNATQRYKGMTFAQAIEAARVAGDDSKPSQNTNWATYHHVLAAFRLAVEARMMPDNPAAWKVFQQMFRKGRPKPRIQFTIDELNRLFRAPLYTGCQNDEAGYAKPGDERPRRGRFWVPLLALFHGMRNNEACQIYTEDVKEAGGVHYIAIREDLEDDSPSMKMLKTKQSVRDVPLHPELVRMGFLDFVKERRRDKASPRLFPELTSGHNGYFSDAFSKWFTRFVKATLGSGCKATLHSFRHQFRNATRAARLPDECVGRLAGWEHGKGPSTLQMHHYGGGPEYLRILAEDLAKVQYPGLDLSHLYRSAPAPSPPPAARLRGD